jgi:hypothetical protein
MSEIMDRDGRRRKAKPGEVLSDGEVLITKMAAKDGVLREVGFDRHGNCVGPIATFDAAAHKPGYRTADSATTERLHGARQVYLRELNDAWRT